MVLAQTAEKKADFIDSKGRNTVLFVMQKLKLNMIFREKHKERKWN